MAGKQVLSYLAAHPDLCVTLDELAAAVDRPRKKITGVISRLITDRYVVRRDRGCYEVTAAGRKADAAGYKCGPQRPLTAGCRKPRPDTLQQRAWKVLRLRRRATVPEIVALAARPDEPNATNALHAYFSRLERAGYVVRLARRAPGTAPTSPGFVIWLLLKDSGPHAPTHNSVTRVIHDRNTDERIKIGGAK